MGVGGVFFSLMGVVGFSFLSAESLPCFKGLEKLSTIDYQKLEERLSKEAMETESLEFPTADNAVDIVLQAALAQSAGRGLQNLSTAQIESRIEVFRQNHPDLQNLKELKELIESFTFNTFQLEWGIQSPKRVKYLYDLTNHFLEFKEKIGEPDDLSAMKKWSDEKTDHGFFKIKRANLASRERLRRLLGKETVIPTRSLQDGLLRLLKKRIALTEIQDLLQEVGSSTGIPLQRIESIVLSISEAHPGSL